jgi:hypothetical protein
VVFEDLGDSVALTLCYLFGLTGEQKPGPDLLVHHSRRQIENHLQRYLVSSKDQFDDTFLPSDIVKAEESGWRSTCRRKTMSTPRTGSSHTSRPQSSLSQRPLSRISSRPLSRISGRTLVSRHAARLAQLSHVMVSQVTRGTLEDDPDLFSDVYGKALRTLETRQVSSESMETVDARVQRYVRQDLAFWKLIISIDLPRRHGLQYKIILQRLFFEHGRT